eukprot:14817167-Ditylum_brightwellii.AAC.1
MPKPSDYQDGFPSGYPNLQQNHWGIRLDIPAVPNPLTHHKTIQVGCATASLVSPILGAVVAAGVGSIAYSPIIVAIK